MHAIWNFPALRKLARNHDVATFNLKCKPTFESMHEHSQFITPFEFGRDAFPNNPCTFEFTFFENKDRVYHRDVHDRIAKVREIFENVN